jgi:hypothetical protein
VQGSASIHGPDLPVRSKKHVKFHRICAQICAEESKLVDHLGSIASDLQRRVRSWKAKRQW